MSFDEFKIKRVYAEFKRLCKLGSYLHKQKTECCVLQDIYQSAGFFAAILMEFEEHTLRQVLMVEMIDECDFDCFMKAMKEVAEDYNSGLLQ